MLSYEEIKNIANQYRYKFDYDSKSFTLINSETKEPVPPSEDTLRIQAALAAYQTLNFDRQANSTQIPTTPEGKLQWEENKIKELQNFVLSVAQNRNYTFDKNLGQNVTIGERFFFEMTDRDVEFIDDTRQFKIDSSKKLMEYLLAEKGKKMGNLDIRKDTSGVKTYFNWDVKDMSFSEKLNPNSPQYTQPQKPQEIKPETQAKIKAYTEKLVSYYLATETDEMYQDRVNNEDKNMRYAASSINNSKEIQVKDKDFAKLMRLLLASKNISLDGQTDYFEQLISQPSIIQALADIRKSGKYDRVKAEAEQLEQDGKLTNGKQRGHFETKGELGLRIANRTIANNPEFIKKANYFVANREKFSINEQSESEAIALCAVARTQGKIPSYTQKTDGSFEFNTDEQISR